MTESPLPRREFLKTLGIGLTAAALAAAGTGCGRSPGPSESQSGDTQTAVETPSFTYGEGSSTKGRILVAYATRTGSTVGVASAIGETLAGRGYAVDVKPFLGNPSSEGYDALVLGSAINGGQWLPEAVDYVKEHQQAITRVSLALFCVHIMNLGDDENSRNNRLAYLDSVRSLAKPFDEAYFAGIGMDPQDTPALVRWVYRTFKLGGEGDCRDWEKIRGWAQYLSLS